jgi:DNA replication factor GINS
MYNELYEVWKRELDSSELEQLPQGFYSKIADYSRRLKEESRMLDKRTVKASLLKKEMQNVKHMIYDLIRTRYKKVIRKTFEGENSQTNSLTVEEEKIYAIFPSAETYRSFVKSVLRGYLPKVGAKKKRNRAILRFLKDVPSIIGADMKSYGPFKSEDVASLPIENAKILVKHGLTEKVEAE